MSQQERPITIDEICQLEAFIAIKKRLLTEASTAEVRELLQTQINDLYKRKEELMDEFSPGTEQLL